MSTVVTLKKFLFFLIILMAFSLPAGAPSLWEQSGESSAGSTAEGGDHHSHPASPAAARNPHSRLKVFVSLLPQAYFLERIGGRRVDVAVLVGEGQSPHTYEPTPQQMAQLAVARAFFCIGVPLEKGVLRKISNTHRQLVIVETQQGVPYQYFNGNEDIHRHGEGHRDQEGQAADRRSGDGAPTANGAPKAVRSPDPHIWMSPRLVKIQAKNICQVLCRLDPAHRNEYAANLQSFQNDLDRVDARIAKTLAPLQGKKMYVFHPAFGYFAAAYGLIQVPVERAGKEPSARQLAALIAGAKRDGVKVMFVQRQFPARSAATAAKAIGGAVVPIDPLARDYLANLERIAAAVERGMR